MGDPETESRQPPSELAVFLEPLAAIERILQRSQKQGIIIGGVAASLLGRPRLTADVDAMILLDVSNVESFLHIAREEGLLPRISDVVSFARRNRVLLLNHQTSGINVDISLGILPFEYEAVERSQNLRLGQFSVFLPTPEDLIIQKAIAGRPKDIQDIQNVVASHPEIDRERIMFWVEQFADILERPQMLEDLMVLLEQTK